jgi:excisionase family DNA binding protein
MNEVMTGKDIGINAVKGRLLSVKEVASFLRVSERWVEKKMNDSMFPLPWFPVGERNRLVPAEDLDKWLSKIKIDAGTVPLPLKAIRKIKKEVSV